jgi:DNA-binding HxlR family transcriptional regulator
MCHDKDHIYLCAAGGILSIISKKWALMIIYKLGTRGRLRFSDFSTELDKINPQALSETLKDLVSEGLIQRESFPEVPPRVEYFLTPEGQTLWESVKPLIHWAAERDYRDKDRCDKTCRKRMCRGKDLQCKKEKRDEPKDNDL